MARRKWNWEGLIKISWGSTSIEGNTESIRIGKITEEGKADRYCFKSEDSIILHPIPTASSITSAIHYVLSAMVPMDEVETGEADLIIERSK